LLVIRVKSNIWRSRWALIKRRWRGYIHGKMRALDFIEEITKGFRGSTNGGGGEQ